MLRVAVGTIMAAMIAAPAFALTVSEVDTDGDSLISFTEMAAIYPDLTEDVFGEVDTSDDSMVDETELVTALESGMIEAPAE